MNKDKNHREKAHKKLNDWKYLSQLLNELLQLEAAQIKGQFENQKKNLRVWLESVNDSLHNVKDLSDEKAQKLKSSIEMLRVQVALGKAETEDNLREQQEKISIGIRQLQMNITEAYDSSKVMVGNFAEDTAEKLDDFHNRFDLFNLQFHLGKEEAKENWKEKKKEILKVLHTINLKIEKGYEDRAENWDHFSDEMSEAWQRIRNAFTV